MPTINLQVGASTDDARNISGNGAFNATNTTYRMGNDAGTDVWDGFRWLNVTVPQGATISSATLDLFSAQTGQGTTAKVILYGELSANPVTFSNTTANKPEGRTRTTASHAESIDVATFNTSSAFGNWPIDVTALVQEIVNQATFASGNALVIVGHDNGSATSNNIGFATYDASGNTKGAKLSITYTTGSSPQTITPSLVSSSPTVYAPTVKGKNTLAPSLVSSSPTVYAPTVKSVYTLAPAKVTSSPTVYSPTITTGAVTITPGLVASLPTVYAPTVKGKNTLTPGLASSSPTVYAPTVTSVYTITPNLVSSTPTVYAPTVTTSAQVISPDVVSSSPTVYVPTVKGAYTITPAKISSAPTVYAPTITVGAVTITPALVSSSPTVHAPTVKGVYTITPALVVSAPTVYAPSVFRKTTHSGKSLIFLLDGRIAVRIADNLYLPL